VRRARGSRGHRRSAGAPHRTPRAGQDVVHHVVVVGKIWVEQSPSEMLVAGGGRRCDRDKILANADLDFSKAPVGVPWIDEWERDGSSCCEVVKRVQTPLGRVTESVVTSANYVPMSVVNTSHLHLGPLRGCNISIAFGTVWLPF